MTIEQGLGMVRALYEDAKDKDYIGKPISYALYHAWEWMDGREKPRQIGGEK